MGRKRNKKNKKEFLGRIDPNLIKTRVNLDNKPIVHKNRKKLKDKYKARRKVKKDDEE